MISHVQTPPIASSPPDRHCPAARPMTAAAMTAQTAVAAATATETRWQRLDRLLSYIFFGLFFAGGMFVPLGLMIFSWFQ